MDKNAINNEISTKNPLNYLYSYIDVETPFAEQALWRSVILQAVRDVTNDTHNSKERLIRSRALSWFSVKNRDFRTVCSFAGLDPELVVKGIKHAMKYNKKLPKRGVKVRKTELEKKSATPVEELYGKVIRF